MTFREWMKAVDLELVKLSGLTHHDLADAPFQDWYHDDMEPAEAARELLDGEGFPFGD